MPARGPMPHPPRRWKRRLDRDGHHRDCCYQVLGPGAPCTCLERDTDDFAAECERRYDAWKNGDYAPEAGEDARD